MAAQRSTTSAALECKAPVPSAHVAANLKRLAFPVNLENLA